MLNKILYKLKTRNYFHPEKEIEVGEEDFVKILKGEVFNPVSKQMNSQRYADYAYMVVGVSEKSPLNSWAGQRWGADGYWNAHENALWYGKFCCEHPSRIVVPFSHKQIEFNPHSQTKFGRFIISEFEEPPFYGGGFMQVDKDSFSRTLVSSLMIDDMEDLVKELYGEF